MEARESLQVRKEEEAMEMDFKTFPESIQLTLDQMTHQLSYITQTMSLMDNRMSLMEERMANLESKRKDPIHDYRVQDLDEEFRILQERERSEES